MILFAHGWGYDASFWNPLRKALNMPSAALDLGYFGPAETTMPDGIAFLVGHSLGFLWLARQVALKHLPLIGINAFPRFVEAEDYRPAVAPRVLERMRRRVLTDAPGVLAEFWQRAGAPGPNNSPNTAALAEGLDQLATWDERKNLGTRTRSMRLIAGEEDAIVPAAMTKMAFGNLTIEWLPGGHVLPWTHPADIARLIRPAMDAR